MRRLTELATDGVARLYRLPSLEGGRCFVYRLWIGPGPTDVLPLSPSAAAEWIRHCKAASV